MVSASGVHISHIYRLSISTLTRLCEGQTCLQTQLRAWCHRSIVWRTMLCKLRQEAALGVDSTSVDTFALSSTTISCTCSICMVRSIPLVYVMTPAAANTAAHLMPSKVQQWAISREGEGCHLAETLPVAGLCWHSGP